MSVKAEKEGMNQENELKYALGRDSKFTESLDIAQVRLGQRKPQHCPRQVDEHSLELQSDVLGEPLSIVDVARLLGCSAWTVRQRYMPAGLPYFRLGSSGKLTFYRNQITRWILNEQKKGGTAQ